MLYQILFYIFLAFSVYLLAVIVYAVVGINKRDARQKTIADGMLPGEIKKNAKDLYSAFAGGNNFKLPFEILCKSVIPYVNLRGDLESLNHYINEIAKAMVEEKKKLILPEVKFIEPPLITRYLHVSIGTSGRKYLVPITRIDVPDIISQGSIFVKDPEDNDNHIKFVYKSGYNAERH